MLQDAAFLLQARPANLKHRVCALFLPGVQVGDAVKVSLHDCLACSGCVTSAETVLLQHQSGEEFLSKLHDPGAIVVISMSPQSRAALAGLSITGPVH
jgi:hypothetical protein